MYLHIHDAIIEEGKETELCNSSSIACLEDRGTDINSRKNGDDTSGRVLRESHSRNIASTQAPRSSAATEKGFGAASINSKQSPGPDKENQAAFSA